MESSSSGSGDVHAHLSSQPDKGDGMSGKFDVHEGVTGQSRAFAGRARDRAEDLLGSARSRTSEWRDRIGEARDRAENLMDDAETTLENRTGVLRTAREKPLAALGVAFAIGFILAGSGEEDRHPSVAKAKNQIKGAIMGGVSAAISQQLRTFIEEQGGIGSLFAALGVPLGGAEEDAYYDPDHDLGEI